MRRNRRAAGFGGRRPRRTLTPRRRRPASARSLAAAARDGVSASRPSTAAGCARWQAPSSAITDHATTARGRAHVTARTGSGSRRRWPSPIRPWAERLLTAPAGALQLDVHLQRLRAAARLRPVRAADHPLVRLEAVLAHGDGVRGRRVDVLARDTASCRRVLPSITTSAPVGDDVIFRTRLLGRRGLGGLRRLRRSAAAACRRGRLGRRLFARRRRCCRLLRLCPATAAAAVSAAAASCVPTSPDATSRGLSPAFLLSRCRALPRLVGCLSRLRGRGRRLLGGFAGAATVGRSGLGFGRAAPAGLGGTAVLSGAGGGAGGGTGAAPLGGRGRGRYRGGRLALVVLALAEHHARGCRAREQHGDARSCRSCGWSAGTWRRCGSGRFRSRGPAGPPRFASGTAAARALPRPPLMRGVLDAVPRRRDGRRDRRRRPSRCAASGASSDPIAARRLRRRRARGSDGSTSRAWRVRSSPVPSVATGTPELGQRAALAA